MRRGFIVQVRNVVQSFGNLNAVDGAELRPPANAISGLIGPKGAGKQRFQPYFAGSLQPPSGEIRFSR